MSGAVDSSENLVMRIENKAIFKFQKETGWRFVVCTLWRTFASYPQVRSLTTPTPQ